MGFHTDFGGRHSRQQKQAKKQVWLSSNMKSIHIGTVDWWYPSTDLRASQALWIRIWILSRKRSKTEDFPSLRMRYGFALYYVNAEVRYLIENPILNAWTSSNVLLLNVKTLSQPIKLAQSIKTWYLGTGLSNVGKLWKHKTQWLHVYIPQEHAASQAKYPRAGIKPHFSQGYCSLSKADLFDINYSTT